MKISGAVIRRLPKYYRYMTELSEYGIQRVSSRELACGMGLTASQVRQDFTCLGALGQQGYGYNVNLLSERISEVLGLKNGYTAVLISAGNLGQALMNNFGFEKSGFLLFNAFDINDLKIGRVINGTKILDIKELDEFCRLKKPDVAVSTCPSEETLEIAQRCIKTVSGEYGTSRGKI